jgi:hypothetical protein
MLIGRESHDHVRVAILDRPFEDDSDQRGRNLLRGMVHAAAGPFQGAYRADFYAWDLEAFRDDLQALRESRQGSAALDAADGGLRVEFSAVGPGRCVVRCVARDLWPSGARLEFEVRLDRADLAPVVRDLDALLRAFPVIRGS